MESRVVSALKDKSLRTVLMIAAAPAESGGVTADVRDPLFSSNVA